MANAALLEVRTLRANLEEEIRDLREKQKNLEEDVSHLEEKVAIESLEKKQKKLQKTVSKLEAQEIKLESKIKEPKKIRKTETEPKIQKEAIGSHLGKKPSEETKSLKNKKTSQIIFSLGVVFAFVGLVLLAMYDPLSFFPWIFLFFGLLVGAWGIFEKFGTTKDKRFRKELINELSPENSIDKNKNLDI